MSNSSSSRRSFIEMNDGGEEELGIHFNLQLSNNQGPSKRIRLGETSSHRDGSGVEGGSGLNDTGRGQFIDITSKVEGKGN
jgi:hypothetical protein